MVVFTELYLYFAGSDEEEDVEKAGNGKQATQLDSPVAEKATTNPLMQQ